ncbi:MAG: hypothetical protein IPM99_06015 [Rubrivivax sp.]|nr:hypothetical protein [Rubrivivax sp.]
MAVVVAGWLASGHCANLMRAGFRDIGLAASAAVPAIPYRSYWTMVLGSAR